MTLRHDSYDRISFMGGVNLGIKEVVKRNQLVYVWNIYYDWLFAF